MLRPYPCGTSFQVGVIEAFHTIKVFRNSSSEAIPIFFNRLKSVFFPCPIAIKFSPVIGYGLKFVEMQF